MINLKAPCKQPKGATVTSTSPLYLFRFFKSSPLIIESRTQSLKPPSSTLKLN